MKTHPILPYRNVVSLSASALLIAAIPSWAACGPGSPTITVLPNLGGTFYQVMALNDNGDAVGLSHTPGNLQVHAFKLDSGGVTDLGTLGGSSSQGFALNNHGQAVGESSLVTDVSRGFLHDGAGISDIGTLGGDYSTALAINDAGQIFGHSETPGNATLEAFVYEGGSMISLGHLGGEYSTVVAANQSGHVAGSSLTALGELHGFLYRDGMMIDLGSLGGGFSLAYAVNNNGDVVGDSALATGEPRGFVYSGGNMLQVGTLGGSASSAYGINNVGQVIGMSTTAGDAQFRGFIYSGGLIADLGTLGGHYSAPRAINDVGQVVGEAETAGSVLRAFLWQNGSMIDLNSLLPAGSGWELHAAKFINNSGRIVGQGTLNGQSRWYILDLGNANNPPVANAGDDQTTQCNEQVTLDGSLSNDPDGDSLSYQWSYAGIVFSTNMVTAATFGVGAHEVTLTVIDPCGESSQDVAVISVTDNTKPVITSCPSNLTVSVVANCSAPVPDVVPQVVVADNCTASGNLSITQNPAAGTKLGTGTHIIRVTVTDESGNSSDAEVILKIADTTPPVIDTIAADPCKISPPNNSLVPVTIMVSAADDCDHSPVSQIISITADEPVPSDDIQITGPLTAMVRASKNATGDTRIYTIAVQCSDSSGNSSIRSVAVTVLKNQSGK